MRIQTLHGLVTVLFLIFIGYIAVIVIGLIISENWNQITAYYWRLARNYMALTSPLMQ